MVRLFFGIFGVLIVTVIPPGMSMATSDDGPRALVHALLNINTSDLPASRKTSGLQSHSSKLFMCTMCTQRFDSLGDPNCFDPSGKFFSIVFALRRHANLPDRSC